MTLHCAISDKSTNKLDKPGRNWIMKDKNLDANDEDCIVRVKSSCFIFFCSSARLAAHSALHYCNSLLCSFFFAIVSANFSMLWEYSMLKTAGGGQLTHRRKSPIMAMMLHFKQQKTYQWEASADLHRVKAQPLSINGPYRAL